MNSSLLVKNFLNLFLKSNCPLCARSTSSQICPNCIKQLQKSQFNDSCVLWKQPLPVFAWGAYGGILKRSIAVMKYERNPEIGLLLGQWLGQQWQTHSPIQTQFQKLIVIPIPLHPNKLKNRGFNQAERIAQGFCNVTGFKLQQRLQRIQDTQALHDLSEHERKKSLSGALVVRNPHHIKTKVLIIDDIYTTGATALEAVKTLNQAGIEVSGVAVTAAPAKYNKSENS